MWGGPWAHWGWGPFRAVLSHAEAHGHTEVEALEIQKPFSRIHSQTFKIPSIFLNCNIPQYNRRINFCYYIYINAKKYYIEVFKLYNHYTLLVDSCCLFSTPLTFFNCEIAIFNVDFCKKDRVFFVGLILTVYNYNN